jgi:hypothetical protein
MIEHQFIGNTETCMLHLDATFRNFIQGDLSMSNYCHKMKSMVDSLADLGYAVSDRNLILIVLRGLNKCYDHLRAIIKHSSSFSSFHKVRENLVLEELTLSPDMPAPPPQAFYSSSLLHLIPLAMAARVKGRVVTIAAIVEMAEAMVAGATMLLAKATRVRVVSPTLPRLLGPPTIVGLGPSICTPVQPWGWVGGGSVIVYDQI